MEIKEKLELFHEAVLQAAGEQSESLLEEYKRSYKENLDAYELQKQKEQETGERIEEAKLRKEWNRQVSEQALLLKKEYHEFAEQKKGLLFEKVTELLEEYRKTDAYKESLVRAIGKAKKFAREEPVIIYLNPTEAAWKEELEQKTGCELTISTMEFMGGIRAVIRSKNILIDESFATKLEQERENYSF